MRNFREGTWFPTASQMCSDAMWPLDLKHHCRETRPRCKSLSTHPELGTPLHQQSDGKVKNGKYYKGKKWEILHVSTHRTVSMGASFSSVPTKKHCGSSNLFQKQILAHRPSCVHSVPSCALYPFMKDGKFINEDAVESQLDQTQRIYLRSNRGSRHCGAKHEKKS